MNMKRLLIAFALLFGISASMKAEYDTPVTFQQLPAKAQSFIRQYFPERKIALSKKERELSGTTYDVIFSNGDKIEFFGNGDWKEIQCKTTLVPEALIPAPILDYVKTNYPEAGITEIECRKRGYEISLTNRLEIEFNKQFVVIDIDD
jgi:hypothetical protein